MARKHNTDKNGSAWTPEVLKAVWEKGNPIPDYSKEIWRKDKCGKAMKWQEHGNRQSVYGWEVDHIIPVAHSGGDQLSNLQPLHWENNASKGDSLTWNCPK